MPEPALPGVGFTGAIAINADIESMSGMRRAAFALRCAGFSRARVVGRDACVAAAKSLLGFRTSRERLEARPGILVHGPLSGRPIREYSGLTSCPYDVKFLRHA